MKQIIFFVSVLLLATACNGKKTDKPENMQQLSFKMDKYEMKSILPELPEAKIKVEVPVAEGDSSNVERINHRIFDAVKSLIALDGDTASNYNELFAGFITNYEKFIKEFPDSPGGWEAILDSHILYNTSKLVNIKLDSYSITGGAHGNTLATSLIFDPKTGNELFVDDIVKDMAAVDSVAEAWFRKKYGISADKPINSTGLMFPDDKFVLPKNVFITKEGLLLFYNQYEIASYADGSKEVILPNREIKDFLNIELW